MLLLWTISNAVLIAVGIMGVIVSVTVAVIAPMSYKRIENVSFSITSLSGILIPYHVKLQVAVSVQMEELDQKSIESNYVSIPKYPPSDVIAIVKPRNEAEGSTSDLYEMVESPRPSDKKSSEGSACATSFRSSKKSSNNLEDFEIQIDNGHHSYSSKSNGLTVYNGWLSSPNLAPSDNKLADSETQEEEGWKTIQVPKEDILIHAPSSPNQREPEDVQSLDDDIAQR